MTRWRSTVHALALASMTSAETAAQSSHLNALEGSAPAPIVEPLAGVLGVGLATLWTDPTGDPSRSGLFFNMYQSSFASVRLFQGVMAFRLGPRWSLSFGQSDIPNLFDSSLTNLDPGLTSLRARAMSVGLDATAARGSFIASAGLSSARDENVGDFQGSSLARVHARFAATRWASFGIRSARVVGGSIERARAGRIRMDATIHRQIRGVDVQAAVAVSHGRLWRFSETNSGVAVAVYGSVRNVLTLGVGVGRYGTTFGSAPNATHRTVSAALQVAQLLIGASFTSTQLGAGSGYSVSIGYEPARPSSRNQPPR